MPAPASAARPGGTVRAVRDDPARPPGPGRQVVVRRVGWADVPWLCGAGLSPELVGRQYHPLETPLQLVVAPARAVLGPRGPAAVVEVDGRRAGYIGRNPLSGNLEYFLRPWARGGGVGRVAITELLTRHRPGDRPRRFFVSARNDRSLRALLGALDAMGWQEGTDYWVDRSRFGREVWVGVGRSAADVQLDG